MNHETGSRFLKPIAFGFLLVLAGLTELPTYGHLYGLNFQEWKNQGQNILIQFETSPQTPTAGRNSTLNFSVQDLATGEHLSNFTETVTIIHYNNANMSSNEIEHKFDSKVMKNGDFTLDYIFQKGGTYLVFLRVDTPAYITVSRFTVFVSSPQFQVMNMVYLMLPIMIFVGIFAGIGVALIRYIYKKR